MPVERGISWSFQKDMTVFSSLLRSEQSLLFDLGNVVDGVLYTGIYNVILEALYFDDAYPQGLHPADAIYPIANLSAAAANQSSVFSVPDDNAAVSLFLPPNTKSAIVSLLASGNGAEEFWYTNVPTEYIDTFPTGLADGLYYGYSAFREVQLLLDGQLAGVSWPFPILFTGGVDPGLWRPVVGIDAFELPSFEIDVSPWLGVLCDGEEHTFQIQVVGYDSSSPDELGTVGQNWWVTGTVFVWVDEETTSQAVSGSVMSNITAPVFEYLPKLTTSVDGSTNESLWVSLTAHRTLSISSSLTTPNGTKEVSWTQDLSFSNILNVSNGALNSSLAMESYGTFAGSPSGSEPSRYSYPLNLYSSYYLAENDDELSSVFAVIDRSLLTSSVPALSYLTGMTLGTAVVATRQNVTSNYYWNATIVGGIEDLDTCDGETWFSSSQTPGSEFGVANYSRYLREKDDSVAADEEGWVTISVPSTQPLPSHL